MPWLPMAWLGLESCVWPQCTPCMHASTNPASSLSAVPLPLLPRPGPAVQNTPGPPAVHPAPGAAAQFACAQRFCCLPGGCLQGAEPEPTSHKLPYIPDRLHKQWFRWAVCCAAACFHRLKIPLDPVLCIAWGSCTACLCTAELLPALMVPASHKDQLLCLHQCLVSMFCPLNCFLLLRAVSVPLVRCSLLLQIHC